MMSATEMRGHSTKIAAKYINYFRIQPCQENTQEKNGRRSCGVAETESGGSGWVKCKLLAETLLLSSEFSLLCSFQRKWRNASSLPLRFPPSLLSKAFSSLGEWKWHEISFDLPADINQHLTATPCCSNLNIRDSLGWKSQTDGSFDLKFGYTLAISNASDLTIKDYRWIWNLNCHTRLAKDVSLAMYVECSSLQGNLGMPQNSYISW
ncbi:uncharacterized protein G2W53_013810 [Senna tora]|uniref:Uncharacterized protein n=1 Tax=Senna tora TaxID=362788 RepID=A0A834U154_9FABA|nr:uncharacterized protein G2W53_013810 [Senna tora]